MGEYAIRNSDGAKVKIGTCESMYYLRYGDRDKVTPETGSGFGCYWRLPFPDEDDVLPGDYEHFNRACRLCKNEGTRERPRWEPFPVPDYALDDPGILQMRHECGLMVNAPCYHDAKLPEATAPTHFFWNGIAALDFIALANIREDNGELFPVIRCQVCGGAWRSTWADVLPYVPDAELRRRLEKLASVPLSA